MFEKVRAPDARFQDMMGLIYNDYKIEQGYSPNEIIEKSKSLKGIMEPFSSSAVQPDPATFGTARAWPSTARSSGHSNGTRFPSQ